MSVALFNQLPLVFFEKRELTIKRLLLSGLVALCFTAFFFTVERETWGSYFISLLFLVVALSFSWLTLVDLRKLFTNTPQIVLSHKGISFQPYACYLKTSFIAWNKIESIGISQQKQEITDEYGGNYGYRVYWQIFIYPIQKKGHKHRARHEINLYKTYSMVTKVADDAVASQTSISTPMKHKDLNQLDVYKQISKVGRELATIKQLNIRFERNINASSYQATGIYYNKPGKLVGYVIVLCCLLLGIILYGAHS